MSTKKINIIVEQDWETQALRGYKSSKRATDAMAVTRIVNRGLTPQFKHYTKGGTQNPIRDIYRAIKGTYKHSVDFVEEILERTFDESIQLPDFKVFAPISTDSTEKLFYKIMIPSATVNSRGKIAPQFGLNEDFAALYQAYYNQDVGGYSRKGPRIRRQSTEAKLAKRFKKDLEKRGFEKFLFAPEEEFNRRLFHSFRKGTNRNIERAEALFSPFYNPKYPNIKTFQDFQDHFKKDKRFNFLVQVIKTRRKARYEQERFDESLGHAYTSFFVVAGFGLGGAMAGSATLSSIVIAEMGLFLAEETIRNVILDGEGSVLKFLVDEYTTSGTIVARAAIDAADSATKLENCIKTGKAAAPFKDCEALIDHTNNQVQLIEEAMQKHFLVVFEQMQKESEGFKEGRLSKELKGNLMSLSLKSSLFIEKKKKEDEDDEFNLWEEETLDKIRKIQKLSENLSQNYLAKVAYRMQTVKKESATEKWVSDFKQLLQHMEKRFFEDLESFKQGIEKLKKNLEENNKPITEQISSAQEQEIMLAKSELSDLLETASVTGPRNGAVRLAWAYYYHKIDNKAATEQIKRHTGLIKKYAQDLVDKGNKSLNLKRTASKINFSIHNWFWDNVIESVWIDDLNWTGNSQIADFEKVAPMPRIFIKLKKNNKVLVSYMRSDYIKTEGGVVTEVDPAGLFKTAARIFHDSFYVLSSQFGGASAGDIINLIILKSIGGVKALDKDPGFQNFSAGFSKVASGVLSSKNRVNTAYPNYIDDDASETLDNLKFLVNAKHELATKLSKIKSLSKIEDVATLLLAAEAAGNPKSGNVRRMWPNAVPPWTQGWTGNIKESISRNDLVNIVSEVFTAAKEKSVLLTEQGLPRGGKFDIKGDANFQSKDKGTKGGTKGGNGEGDNPTGTPKAGSEEERSDSEKTKEKTDTSADDPNSTGEIVSDTPDENDSDQDDPETGEEAENQDSDDPGTEDGSEEETVDSNSALPKDNKKPKEKPEVTTTEPPQDTADPLKGYPVVRIEDPEEYLGDGLVEKTKVRIVYKTPDGKQVEQDFEYDGNVAADLKGKLSAPRIRIRKKQAVTLADLDILSHDKNKVQARDASTIDFMAR